MLMTMAKRKTKKHDGGNLHPQFNLRIPDPMRDAIEKVADRDLRSATEVVRTAIREYLERHNLWPPHDASGSDGEAK